MNHRQKLGYMALGALILAIGITIGQFITPNIEAQQNGVFDEITCRRLYVEDEDGKTAIALNSINDLGNGISIYHPNGDLAVGLNSSNDSADGIDSVNGISIFDKNGTPAINLGSLETVNGMSIYHPNGKTAIMLNSRNDLGNGIVISDPNGKASFDFIAYTDSNELSVYNKSDGAGIGFYTDSNEAKQIRWDPPKKR